MHAARAAMYRLMRMPSPFAAAVAALLALLVSPALAQEPSRPQPVSAEPIPVSRDVPYPGGAMTLEIDASDVTRGAYRVTQTIPLAPGTRRMTLLLPQWLPGNHGPRGTIAELVDLRLFADGRPVAWRRDSLEVFAFHVDLPEGVRSLTARFVHTSPMHSRQGRVTMTNEMLNLQWEKMSLYPAGHYVRQIQVRPSVRFPSGWQAATALKGATRSGDRVTWSETDYETLVDSPIFAGAHFRKWNLGNSVSLSVVADDPVLLNLDPLNSARLSAMTNEALAVFGSPPYENYEFLVALSDRIGRIGLEHLESSENQLEPRNFVEWAKHDWDRNVLPHELAHAWNGKWRRPAGLWTPDYRTPMRDDLLWVYEGQTQYWGWILSARSGAQSKDMILGMMAQAAGRLAETPGRGWRSVADTTLDPIVAARKPKPYRSLARGEDYYHEGALIWLEADQLIRRGTAGRKGLDDFARDFFAHPGGDARVSTFDFDDIVAALNRTHAHDWATFLRERIDGTGRPAPLEGIERAGYKLAWKRGPNPYTEARMDHLRNLNLLHSIGLVIDNDGKVSRSKWDSPAFRAGIVEGAEIVAVNGIAYAAHRLRDAISAAPDQRKPIELLVKRDLRYETVPVTYYGGLRWPWLERSGSRENAPLDRLLAPRRNRSTP